MTTERRLAAVLSANVEDCSQPVGEDEAGTVARLEGLKVAFHDPLIEHRCGSIDKVMGDGFLLEIGSVVDAFECAMSCQNAV